MRDVGKELGLLGSSLYSHVESKQDLLVEVVEEGSRLFEESATSALERDGSAREHLGRLIAGHIDVVLDNRDIARTFLNEARMLDGDHRARVLAARDRYEMAFRKILNAGIQDGSFRDDLAPKTDAIYILSMLNAVERWYDPNGALDRQGLVESLTRFCVSGVS